MSDAVIAKTYEGSASNYFGTAAYDSAVSLVESGQNVQLAVFKEAAVHVQGCGAPVDLTTSQSLNLDVTKSSGKITVHFDLTTNVDVDFRDSHGVQQHFSAGVAISGDVTVNYTTQNYCDAIKSCGGQLQTACGYQVQNACSTDRYSCTPDGKIVISCGNMDLSAVTSVFFSDAGSSGSTALILDHGKVTNFAAAIASDGDSSADAAATMTGALALAFAFMGQSQGSDPFAGYTGFDVLMIKALGLDAAVMSDDPSDATAQAATLLTTYLGAGLALDYAGRALAVADAAPTELALSASSDGGAKGDGLTNDRTVTIDGKAGAGDLITLYDGTRAVGTATANSAGVFHVTSSSLADGVHTLTAVSTDGNGYKVTSDPLQVTVDGTGPARPEVAGLSASGLAGTGEAGSQLTVYDNGRSVGSVTVDSDGHWSLARAITDTSTHAYTVAATDAAGNTSTSDGSALIKLATGSVYGASGDDLLAVRNGQTVTGGSGHDLFMVDADSGKATIADFYRGVDDIHIDSSLASSFADLKSHAVQKGYDVVITFDAQHVLTLKSVTLSSLGAGDFVFG
jgi:hypothetical protein